MGSQFKESELGLTAAATTISPPTALMQPTSKPNALQQLPERTNQEEPTPRLFSHADSFRYHWRCLQFPSSSSPNHRRSMTMKPPVGTEGDGSVEGPTPLPLMPPEDTPLTWSMDAPEGGAWATWAPPVSWTASVCDASVSCSDIGNSCELGWPTGQQVPAMLGRWIDQPPKDDPWNPSHLCLTGQRLKSWHNEG
jgi:hypothetical protein